MRPEQYTDDQLRLAILDASDQRRILITTAYELEDIDSLEVRSLRTLLAHLPDPEPAEHPHPEIEFDDVRVGDRIDVLTIYGNREILTVEDRTDLHLLAMGTQIPAMNYVQSIRLISRPTQHPDPKEHPVILAKALDGTRLNHEYYYAWDRVSEQYIAVGHDLLYMKPENITDWEPAIIVPKAQKEVVEDDR